MKWAKRAKQIAEIRQRLGRDRSAARPFPDLSTGDHRERYPSLGDGFGRVQGKKQQHPDAKQFPVGHLHKQGPTLIPQSALTNGELQWYGGKKS